jgi:predicted ATPase
MTGVPSRFLDDRQHCPTKVAGLAIAGHGRICISERSDDLIAGLARSAVLGPKGPQRDRGSTCIDRLRRFIEYLPHGEPDCACGG